LLSAGAHAAAVQIDYRGDLGKDKPVRVVYSIVCKN